MMLVMVNLLHIYSGNNKLLFTWVGRLSEVNQKHCYHILALDIQPVHEIPQNLSKCFEAG